jgi:DDE superfamily endonuclease
MYNSDEKGFLIGLSRSTKRVISIDALKKKRTARASQDGSREFITLVATVCADGSSVAPALIYQGASHDLQDTWLDGFDDSQDLAFFASSEKGWSNDQLGLQWLEHVFDRLTKGTVRDRRLLLLDGHNSHVNLRFINYADANRILLAILPPHSTHRLQPLDVGLFSPLSTYYSQQIDNLLMESQGLVRLTKRDFWPLFRNAWKQAFTTPNVRSAWRTTGIYPLDPEKVIATIVRQKSPPAASPTSKTPVSARSLRRTYKKLQKEGHVDQDAGILLRAGEKLATELEIVRHENNGLRKAIIHEKKKRKRGKAMNLYDPDENEGQALFFSPAKVARVRQRNADLEEAERQRKQNLSDKKLQAAIARAEKAREAQEKKNERLLARQAAKEQLAQEKAERKAAREAERAQKAVEAAQRKECAAEARAQRTQAKKPPQKMIRSKKRSIEVKESERPKKRRRTNLPQSHNATISNDSRNVTDNIDTQLSGTTVAVANSATPAVRMRGASGRPISLPLRSGRRTNLPSRFK